MTTMMTREPATRLARKLVVGALVVIVVLATDVRAAIGASSFAVLVYYGIANASALTLREGERRFPRVRQRAVPRAYWPGG